MSSATLRGVPTPTAGSITEEEKAAVLRWLDSACCDPTLLASIDAMDIQSELAYVLVRALRAGAELGDLL
jgi:hypothetical protein